MSRTCSSLLRRRKRRCDCCDDSASSFCVSDSSLEENISMDRMKQAERNKGRDHDDGASSLDDDERLFRR